MIKDLFVSIINRIARPMIPVVDARKNPRGTNVIQPKTQYVFDLSQIQTGTDRFYWQSMTNVNLDALFYQKLQRGHIVGNGIVINNGRVVLESTLFQKEYLFKLGQNHLIFSSFFQKKIVHKNWMLSLSYVLEDNYYHWVVESLTRVLLIHKLIDLNGVLVVINDHKKKFKTDSLQFLFGIHPENIVFKRTHEVLKGPIVVPSFIQTRNPETQMTDICHPQIIKLLNEKTAEKMRTSRLSTHPKMFVLSRRQAPDRRILNENFLLNGLDGQQFSIIETEDLSFEDQVQLFFNARIIISTHGAGLTNIVFSKHVMIIELFPNGRNVRDAFTFTQLSAALGFEHHLITYQPINEQHDVVIDLPIRTQMKAIVDNYLSAAF